MKLYLSKKKKEKNPIRFECSTYLFLTFFFFFIISNNNKNRVTIQITMQLCHTCFKNDCIWLKCPLIPLCKQLPFSPEDVEKSNAFFSKLFLIIVMKRLTQANKMYWQKYSITTRLIPYHNTPEGCHSGLNGS